MVSKQKRRATGSRSREKLVKRAAPSRLLSQVWMSRAKAQVSRPAVRLAEYVAPCVDMQRTGCNVLGGDLRARPPVGSSFDGLFAMGKVKVAHNEGEQPRRDLARGHPRRLRRQSAGRGAAIAADVKTAYLVIANALEQSRAGWVRGTAAAMPVIRRLIAIAPRCRRPSGPAAARAVRADTACTGRLRLGSAGGRRSPRVD
jgi:hypothetical protein